MGTSAQRVEAAADAPRLLGTLEQLLALPATDLQGTLSQASQLLVQAMHTDKVDVFLYDRASDALVALGVSNTPMGRREQAIGLDHLPLAAGGRVVEVFQSGIPYLTAHADADPHVNAGFREELGVRSLLAVPLEIGGQRRGVLAVDSAQPNAFSADDLRFFQAIAHWVGMVAQRAELSEQVAQEAATQARRRAADELIRVLAHDLRAPLTALQGHLSLLRRQAQREGRADDLQHATGAERAARRLAGLISDLLDTGRLEQGVFTVSRQPINLSALVHETANTLRAPTAAIQVAAPAELLVCADPARVRQALENLLANALRYTPPGVPVVVQVGTATRADGTWAVVTVRDEGPGIAPDLLPTIGERFTSGPDSPGLGLGLYLARGIAQAHGGTLTVDSQGGAGTRVHLALPLDPRCPGA
jgi:two-component system OmpR family sensor kinase